MVNSSLHTKEWKRNSRKISSELFKEAHNEQILNQEQAFFAVVKKHRDNLMNTYETTVQEWQHQMARQRVSNKMWLTFNFKQS